MFIGNWKEAFGEDYQVPEEITSLLVDQSHKGSLCPSFLIGHREEREITLWVEHVDPKKRCKECQESRFLILKVNERTGRSEILAETDDAEVAVIYIKCYMEH